MIMIPITLHDSIKPAGLVRRGLAKFARIQFGGWAARASVASPNGRALAKPVPETAAPEPKWIPINLAAKQETTSVT